MKNCLSLIGGLILVTGSLSASVMATATYTDTALGGGEYQYDLTLDNTGTTTIGTFWFSWVPGAGFMTATPTDIMSPPDWNAILTNSGSAIQWTTSTLLMPGDSLSGFQFDSTMTPADFEGVVPSGLGAGDPITTSFAYIAAPLADPGFQLAATPATTATPEPGTWLSTTIGFCLIVLCSFALRRRKRA